MIIPFFIPHAGCPHQCVFCNQKRITGAGAPPDPASLSGTITAYLSSHRDKGPVQVAFYGGSFTALPREQQKHYLSPVQPFIASGLIENIRISTRPDAVNEDILKTLKAYHVTVVELGAQSMDDRVLALARRGHTADNTVNAAQLLRECDFSIGLQLMPGLPGDSPAGFLRTVDEVIALKPDFVRLYPALVVKGTPLAEQYAAGQYIPLSLADAVALCREALLRFVQAGIAVIRVGLQPTEELQKPGAILAGPYHPAFRHLVESSIFLDRMRTALRQRKTTSASATFRVNGSDLSAVLGWKRSNVAVLTREFRLRTVQVVQDHQVARGTVALSASPETPGHLL